MPHPLEFLVAIVLATVMLVPPAIGIVAGYLIQCEHCTESAAFVFAVFLVLGVVYVLPLALVHFLRRRCRPLVT